MNSKILRARHSGMHDQNLSRWRAAEDDLRLTLRRPTVHLIGRMERIMQSAWT